MIHDQEKRGASLKAEYGVLRNIQWVKPQLSKLVLAKTQGGGSGTAENDSGFLSS